MKIPSSITMAENLVSEYPYLFNKEADHSRIVAMLSIAMQEYYDKCREYINQDQSAINEIKDQLKELNNLPLILKTMEKL